MEKQRELWARDDGHLRFFGDARVEMNDYDGIFVQNGSSLQLRGPVEVSGNGGQGIFITQNSHAIIGADSNGGVRVENNGSNGVVVVHSSTLELQPGG